jgi:hypothetical protein
MSRPSGRGPGRVFCVRLRGRVRAAQSDPRRRLLLFSALAVVVAALPAYAQAPPQQPIPRAATVPPAAPQRLPEWLRIGVEHRGRLEGPANAGFNDRRDDAYWLNRFRFDVRVRPLRLLSFHVQAQDAQVFGRNSKPDAPPFEDTLDLRMAYADLGQTGTSPVLVRLGRQELAFGEQRLVGHANWVNTARTFDAARVTVARKTFKIDGFASSVVTMRDGDFNRSRQGESFYGAYGSFIAIVPNATLEPYVLARNVRSATAESGTLGRLESVTFGARWLGKLPAGLDYNTEMALQRGSLASDDISAWAGHWLVGRTTGTRTILRLSGEYNYASGDRDPKDGRRNTFDQLYPTAHDKYGLADQVGWRNVHHLRTAADVRPNAKWTIGGSYHSWWLASTTDGLYTAAGAVLVRPVAGFTDSHVGQELDVQTTYPLSPRIHVSAGYAYIVPGAFLKAATPGTGYSFPYVMVTSTILRGDR